MSEPTLEEMQARIASLERKLTEQSHPTAATTAAGASAAPGAAALARQATPPPAVPPVSRWPKTVFERALVDFEFEARLRQTEWQQHFERANDDEFRRALMTRAGRADGLLSTEEQPMNRQHAPTTGTWIPGEFCHRVCHPSDGWMLEIHRDAERYWYLLRGPGVNVCSNTFLSEHEAANSCVAEYRKLQKPPQVVGHWLHPSPSSWRCELLGWVLEIFGDPDQGQFGWSVTGPGGTASATRSLATLGAAQDEAVAAFRRLRGEVAA